MVAIVPTPLPEVADRWAIATLKLERLPADQSEPGELQRQIDYYAAGLDFNDATLVALVERLREINGLIWDAEYAIRLGEDQQLGHAEIGRRALKIRDLNRDRIAVKNSIAEHGGGFKDVKMNHASADR